jgi:hypothetical protein
MQVKTGDRICLEAPAAVEPIEDLLFHDYYTRTPRLRLTGEVAADGQGTEVLLDGNDVARLVECAIRHPSLNMRHAVLTAIWNHPDSFREILRFGLQAAEAFAEIRKIVAEELGKGAAAAAAPAQQAGETLLPKLPLPAHLRGRGKE